MGASGGRLSALFIALSLQGSAFADVTVTEGTNMAVDVSPVDGNIAFDLLGGLWILDHRGGQASPLPGTVPSANTPRWSPSGTRLLYESTSTAGNQLWLYDLEAQATTALSDAAISEQDGSWHPDGERIVFAGADATGQLDLWEQDLPTGLRWRLSDGPGDEFEPAWSANGKHLVYVSKHAGVSRLMLRRRGQQEIELYRSAGDLRAPSFRPDGSVVLFYAEAANRYTMQMAILSEPPIVREFSSTDNDIFLSRVSWRDRQHMTYAADGKIMKRAFGDRRAQPVHFRADVASSQQRTTMSVQRSLPLITPATDRYVIRAARIFDGVADDYRANVDILIDGARISSLDTAADDAGVTVLDLGDVTVLPGFIDVYSALPAGSAAGISLLAYGVTSIVTDTAPVDFDPALWHGVDIPGPRLIPAGELSSGNAIYLATVVTGTSASGVTALRDAATVARVVAWQQKGVPVLADNWTLGLSLGVDLLMGTGTLPTSPGGRQYQDLRTVASGGPITLVSALADAGTPGIAELLRSRQAMAFGQQHASPRRLAPEGRVDPHNASVVIGSKANGLPPGLALHAEMRALAARGLSGRQILRAAGIDAAAELRIDQQVGRIAPGLQADLVLVSGDPLQDVNDALNIVAVVRNGRFFSLISLLERAAAQENVE